MNMENNLDPRGERGGMARYLRENAWRAKRAATAIHAVRPSMSTEPPQTEVVDLMADLMHFCTILDLDVEMVLWSARNHHSAEVCGI